VVLQDITEEFVQKGLGRIRDFLQKGVEKGKVNRGARRNGAGARHHDRPTARPRAGRRGARDRGGAREARTEERPVPRARRGRAPQCVLASNTSSLSLAKVFAGVAGPERCIGMHFFNPVPLMALLELVRTDATSQATIDAVTAYGKQLGKEPILVKDSPGFATRAWACASASRRSAWSRGRRVGRGHRQGDGARLRPPDGAAEAHRPGRPRRAPRDRRLPGKELEPPGFEAPALMRRMVAEGKLGKKSGQGFYCGSSARKVRRGHANLLGGRALRASCSVWSPHELGDRFRSRAHGQPRHACLATIWLSARGSVCRPTSTTT
jgi:3-hydroxybutyryl-CoA dehydrogenase